MSLLTATRMSMWKKKGVGLKSRDVLRKKPRRVGDKGHAIFDVAAMPKGEYVAVASHVIDFIDLETMKVCKTLYGHVDTVSCLDFSPDGSMLISGGSNATIKLWSLRSRSTGKIAVRETRVKKNFVTAKEDGYVRSVKFTKDMHLIASVAYDTIRVWDVESTRIERDCVRALKSPSRSLVNSFDISTRDRNVIVGAERNGSITVWDLRSAEITATVPPSSAHGSANGGTSSIRFCPNGILLGSGGADGTMNIWDARKLSRGTPLCTQKDAHDGLIRQIRFHDSSAMLLLTASPDMHMKVWSLLSEAVCVADSRHKSPVLSTAISSSGQTAFTGCIDGTLKAWEINPFEGASSRGT
eukprot:g3130.t1